MSINTLFKKHTRTHTAYKSSPVPKAFPKVHHSNWMVPHCPAAITNALSTPEI